MKLTSIASMTVIGATFAGSLLITPGHKQVSNTDVMLPLTGSASLERPAAAGSASLERPAAAVIRINHPIEVEAPQTPVEIYSQYVPPAPTPAPAPVPAPARVAAAPRSWSTPQGYVTIGVPVYRQTRALNCETAALQMGLAYYGHYYSQDALFAYESPDLRRGVWGPNGAVGQWGDPYVNFVGNVNGSQGALTGYGVYYPVILNIARSHGLPNSYGGEGFSARTIYAELAAHHPVEVWVEAHWLRPRVGTWTAWNGRRIRYSLAEHAVTLSGVSATSVRVNDPIHGTQYWVSKATFETSWRDFNNMAVIFR